MLCSAWKTIIKLNVPEIPRGSPSEKEPCPKGYTIKTAAAAATGAEYATEIHGRIPKRKESSHSLPI
jgi:hypothetical protein